MAAPDIVDVTSILGKSTATALSTTNATTVLNNPALSNKVLKVNLIRVTNVDGTVVAEITITYNSEDDGGGTAYALASTITVPADAAIDIITKESSFWLEEDKSIVATAGAANDLEVFISYEEMDDA